ncbi:MAG: hypothetical protein V4507_07290, partial [Verrucomicrobiota bacterium]
MGLFLRVVLFIGLPLVSPLLAQEQSRQALTSSEMIRVLNNEDRYNLRLGEIKLQVDSVMEGELNDNINLSSSKGALSDLILRPGVQVKGDWQATEFNKITGTLGISYAKYVGHPEYDSKMPLIAPNSETAFTLAIGDVRVQVFDRFRMQEDPTTQGQLSNVVSFRRFENEMGTMVDWDLNQFIISGGYMWGTFLRMDTAFDSLDRNTHTFIFAPRYLINEVISVGINNQYTLTDYDLNIQSDTTSLQSGPYVDVQLTKYTSARLEVGYQNFSSDNQGAIGDSSRFSS